MTQLADLFEWLFLWIARFLKAHWRGLVFALACLFVIASLWQWIRPSIQRQAILYTSSPSGDSSVFGERIAAYFKATSSTGFIVRHQIEVLPSEGLMENRRKVNEATDGKLVLGFAQDGFEPPPNVRTLLPLTNVVMHVVANRNPDLKATVAQPTTLGAWWKNFQQDAKKRAAKDHPGNDQAAKSGKYQPRFYLGPQGSGSRQIAERILKHYRFDSRKVDVGAHLGWETAYQQLARGEIDLIFDASDLGSMFMHKMADKGAYVLIGLDDVTGMTAGQTDFSQATIHKNAYKFDSGFCPGDILTVSTKRIIICPKSMSDYDAFYLAAGIREALREIAPTIHWDKKDMPTPDLAFIVPVHPGSEAYRQNREPFVQRFIYDHGWAFITGILSFFSLMVYRRLLAPPAVPAAPGPVAPPPVIVAAATGSLAPAIEPAPAPPVVAPPAPVAVAAPRSMPAPLRALLAEFDTIEGDLGIERPPLTKKQVSAWKTTIRGLRHKLAQARQEFGPTDAETLKDLLGKLGFLETELTDLRQQRTGARLGSP